MKIRALVAKMDSQPGADGVSFAPGSVKPVTVPVTCNFERFPPIGTATISIDGADVFAEINVADADAAELHGKFPALGFVATESRFDSIGFRREILAGDVCEVSVCTMPNSDSRIPPIA